MLRLKIIDVINYLEAHDACRFFSIQRSDIWKINGVKREIHVNLFNEMYFGNKPCQIFYLINPPGFEMKW